MPQSKPPSPTVDLSKPGRTPHAGVILMGTTELLDVAPIDFIAGFSHPLVDHLPIPEEMKSKAVDLQVHWITQKGEQAALTGGLKVEATVSGIYVEREGVRSGEFGNMHHSYEDCPPLDIVLIGAYLPSYTPSAADVAFIRKAYDECAAFITICAGVLPALLSGVLAGHTVTGPRDFIPMLKGIDPSVKWQERRWCRDGKVWTSGTLLNGLDVVREVAKENWADIAGVCVGLAGMVERGAEY